MQLHKDVFVNIKLNKTSRDHFLQFGVAHCSLTLVAW